MERWQKIERCLSEFFRDLGGFEVHQQGDVFAAPYNGEEFSVTRLAKDIDSELGYDAKKDFSNSIDACYDEIKNRVAAGGSGMKSK